MQYSMDNKNRFLKFLGICKKSGKLISGDYSVEKAIIKNKAVLIILAEDCSKEKSDKYKQLSISSNLDLIQVFKTTELGSAIGKSLSAVIAITDINQKNKILSLYNNH